MNETLVKSIITTLEILLGTTLGYALEDLSIDPDVDTVPAAQVIYLGEDFNQEFNERTLDNNINFLIKVEFNQLDVALNRDFAVTRLHQLKTNIKRSLFNNTVALVTHTGANVDYDHPITTINYNFIVKYFDTENNI